MVFLFLLVAIPARARIWRVNPDHTGDAPTIQSAIDSARAGDEVLLAPGTYTWTSQGATPPTMVRMKAGVSLRGEEGPSVTVLDAEWFGQGIRCESVGALRIENVTITQGYAFSGGGIYIAGDSNPTVSLCNFVGNNTFGITGSGLGGALYGGPVIIRDCQFIGNGTEDGNGGAVWCEKALIENCLFKENIARGDEFSGGGALHCRNTAIRGCLFEGNAAGAFVSAAGGAIIGENVTIEACALVDNVAGCTVGRCDGGAVYVFGSAMIRDCIMIGNEAGRGGAVYGSDGAVVGLERCTLVANRSSASGGVGGIALNGPGTVHAVILAYTTAGSVCGGEMSQVSWSCSDLFANVQGDALCGLDAGGNIFLDPEFCAVDPVGANEVGIQEDSPCAPGNHPGGQTCGLIGAKPVACGPVSVRQSSWGMVKQMFR